MGLNWVVYKDFRERLLVVEKTDPPELDKMKEMYLEMVEKAFAALEVQNVEEALVYLSDLNMNSEVALGSFLRGNDFGDFLNTITKINSGDF